MTTQYSWPVVLTGLIQGHDLDQDAARWAMDQVLSGDSTSAQIAGFAVALRAKGETVEELEGLSRAMLERATPLQIDADVVDIVGSGGDRAHTVNISTMAAIVAAGAGARIVKHGNRAASSDCGAADVLEALGVRLDLPADRQQGVLDQTGITFLFAPLYHSSLRHAAAPRRELGVQTTFNFLGPLSHPGRPQAQAIGVANPHIAPLVAGVLQSRGTRGLVFHGNDGLDELTSTTTSQVWLVADGEVAEALLDPAVLGLAPAMPADLQGGDPAHNAAVVREVVSGARGPVRDVVVLNAAAALLAWHGPDLNDPLAPQMARHLRAAERAIDSGRAAEVLDRWIVASQVAD